MSDEGRMHGMIFGALKKYVDTRLGPTGWESLLKEAGLSGRLFLAIESYPDDEAQKLIATASRLMQKDAAAMLEDFGEFTMPDLMKMYGALAKKDWKTLEFLEHTEDTIHKVVRMRNPIASPARLKCKRTAPSEVTITYDSRRRLCALARGFILGVARHFGEEVRITEPECMLKGARKCTLVVQRL